MPGIQEAFNKWSVRSSCVVSLLCRSQHLHTHLHTPQRNLLVAPHHTIPEPSLCASWRPPETLSVGALWNPVARVAGGCGAGPRQARPSDPAWELLGSMELQRCWQELSSETDARLKSQERTEQTPPEDP